MKKKTIFILIATLLMVTLGAFTLTGDSEIEEKIKDELEKSISGAANGDEIISVYIWIRNISQEEVSAEIQRRYGMSYEEAIEANPQLANVIIGEKRQISKAIHMRQNAAFIEKAGLTEADFIFISQFTPMLIANLSVDKIIALAQMDEITSLNKFTDSEGTPEGGTEEPSDEPISLEFEYLSVSTPNGDFKTDDNRISIKRALIP